MQSSQTLFTIWFPSESSAKQISTVICKIIGLKLQFSTIQNELKVVALILTHHDLHGNQIVLKYIIKKGLRVVVLVRYKLERMAVTFTQDSNLENVRFFPSQMRLIVMIQSLFPRNTTMNLYSHYINKVFFCDTTIYAWHISRFPGGVTLSRVFHCHCLVKTNISKKFSQINYNGLAIEGFKCVTDTKLSSLRSTIMTMRR